jgi:hypothetical protein
MEITTRFVATHDGSTRVSWRRLICFLITAFTLFTLVTSATPSAAATPSANGTRGQTVVDGSGATWTLSATHTLRDGVWVGGGAGQEYLYVNLSVYVVTTAGVYKWNDGWQFVGTDAAAILAQASSSGSSQAGAGSSTVKEVVTTGSISANSRQLNVASASGFAVGDWVIVEIGKEAGQGQRGTRGVGGTWPAKSYATEAQLQADRSQANRQFAWAEDTGYVYWWLDGVWYDMAPNRPNTFYTGSYYYGRVIPRSLQARITAISGNTLTLDTAAAASASGANVYLDTAPIMNNLIANGVALNLPAGRFPVGGVVWVESKGGFVVSGQGKDQTTVYSPKGVPSAQIQVYQSPNATVRDLTLQGNFRDQGYGLNWDGSTHAGTNQPVTDFDVPQGSAFPRGVLFWVGSHNSVAQDLRVIDVAQQAVGVMFADNVWGRRIENIQNDLLRQYVQWQFQWCDTTGGGCEDCEVRSTYVISGFESFKSTNVQFIRPKGMNAMMALNGSGGWLIQDADLRFTANSLHPETDRFQASPWHAIINVNTNIGVTPQVAYGGTIRNVTMIQAGYLNANNDSIKGINVNDNNPNIRIEGAAFYAPDFKAPTVSNGPLGLVSTGPSTYINGMLVIGKPGPWANIGIHHGNGQYCTAQTVYGCDSGPYTSAAMSAFLAGSK